MVMTRPLLSLMLAACSSCLAVNVGVVSRTASSWGAQVVARAQVCSCDGLDENNTMLVEEEPWDLEEGEEGEEGEEVESVAAYLPQVCRRLCLPGA